MTEPGGTQKGLRTSEIRYRRLFESARDGILILNANTLRITDVNPFMMELLGYSRDEFLGKELWEIGLFGDKNASQEAIRKLQVKGYLRYEDLPLQTTKGKLREVEFVSNVYDEDGHQVIQCNIRELERQRFDVLISDIGMPVVDGYALIERIRRLPAERGGRIPAAALTAYAGVEDRTRVLTAGYQRHIPKPVEPAELTTVVAHLAGRYGVADGRGIKASVLTARRA